MIRSTIQALDFQTIYAGFCYPGLYEYSLYECLRLSWSEILIKDYAID